MAIGATWSQPCERDPIEVHWPLPGRRRATIDAMFGRFTGRARHVAAVAQAAASLLVATGCTGGTSGLHITTSTTPAITVSPAAVTSPYPIASIACTAGQPNMTLARPLFEVEGQAIGASLWALMFEAVPIVTGRQVKIAWRMSGAGGIRLTAVNLDTGQVLSPSSGPDFHSSSSWHRPGSEWGSIWVFPSQGCWRITATRATGVGSITVTVVKPSE